MLSLAATLGSGVSNSRHYWDKMHAVVIAVGLATVLLATSALIVALGTPDKHGLIATDYNLSQLNGYDKLWSRYVHAL